MKNAIIGFGELANQFLNFLEIDIDENLIIFDDIKYLEKKTNYCKFNEFSDKKFNGCNFYIALGYKNLKIKKDIIANLISNSRKLPNFIDKSSFISRQAEIKKGIFIYPMCNIDKGVFIDDGVIVNNSVVISHNSTIGKCSYISPGVVISGNVTIGSNTFIGSGSIISNNIKIGDNVIIGIGTVVTKDIPDNSSVIGNPMIFLSNKINLE